MYFNFGVATEAVNEFLSNKPANEFIDMKQYLADDITAATEAIDRTGRRMNDYQSRYVLWLTRKAEEKSANVDFGNIPNTRGDITKWDYYRKPITGLMNYVNSILSVNTSDTIVCMKDLNNFLVSQRSDFEYGYKTENSFIILVYQTLCIALIDITALAVVEADKAIADNMTRYAMAKSVKHTKQARTLISSINKILDTWKNGDWNRIMRSFKNSRVDMFKTSKSANEAAALEAAFVGTVATVALVAGIVVTGVIAIVSAIRGLITIYYKSAVNIDTKARSMIAYLDEIAPYENNPEALVKQQKASDKLNKLAGFLEAKIIKEDTRAEAEIAQEDRVATPQEMEFATSDPNGFEFY